jgi:hypothetical protein
MRTWQVCFDVLWHRVRGHRVVEGGNVTVTEDLGAGGFTFVVPRTFTCSCGVIWQAR